MRLTILFFLSLLLLTTACGQKGDLVRPPLPDSDTETTEQAEAISDIEIEEPFEVDVEIEMDTDTTEATDSKASPTAEP